MFNLSQSPKVRGSGHIVLNVLRFCTIMVLLLTVAASFIMVVFSGVKGNFNLFDSVGHVFVAAMAMALVLTETPLLTRKIEKNWPVFGTNHSFAWLGAALIMMGCLALGDLVKPAYSGKNLGSSMLKLVMASGALDIAFGFINILVSVIYHDGNAGITARHIRSQGAIATGSVKSAENYDSSLNPSIRSDGAYPKHSAQRPPRPPRSPQWPQPQYQEARADQVQGFGAKARRLTQIFAGVRKSKIGQPMFVPGPSMTMPTSGPLYPDLEGGAGLRGEGRMVDMRSAESTPYPTSTRSPGNSVRRPDIAHHPALRDGHDSPVREYEEPRLSDSTYSASNYGPPEHF